MFVRLEQYFSLPGALAAYALAVGVFRISDSLPSIVYALLSGLNAATVGIIALAAVQLSRKAATDFITRVLVFMGGSAGLLYNALWYFPVLMAIGGSCTMTWDTRWFRQLLQNAKALMDRRSRPDSEEGDQPSEPVALQGVSGLHDPSNVAPFSAGGAQAMTQRIRSTEQPSQPVIEANGTGPDESPETNVLSWRFGVAVLVLFFVFFIAIMILRGTLHHQTRAFSVFANLFLAGTIIFGGGPVVIPLLREYVVAEGWVSPRNFLLGLAITQAFPGPNFNFGVYLGGLAVAGHSNAAVGALLGYIAIFSPGIVVHTGTMSLWKNLRERRWFTSALRGVNATAVGLIYTAVYRLWQQGLLSDTYTLGSSLDSDPWWVVVAATSFVGGHWFGVPAPAAIVLGGVMGLVWYGVVTK